MGLAKTFVASVEYPNILVLEALFKRAGSFDEVRSMREIIPFR